MAININQPVNQSSISYHPEKNTQENHQTESWDVYHLSTIHRSYGKWPIDDRNDMTSDVPQQISM